MRRALLAAVLLAAIAEAAGAQATVGGYCKDGENVDRTVVTAPIDDARVLVMDQACPDESDDPAYSVIEWDALVADVLSNLVGGDGLACSGSTCTTQSDETGFLEDLGASDLTCGAATAGKMAVNDADALQYCDGASTPVRRTAAFGDDAGAALTGDSATSFFSTGEVADAQVSNTLTASTTTTQAANDDDTDIASTAFVQQEINGAGGRSLTCASGSCDADQELYEQTKCINIDPDHSTTDWLFFRAERAITLVGIDCIVDASTSVVMTLRECNSNAASCGDSEAAITCGTTNTTEASSIDDSAVDAGDWMRVTRGTETGTVTQAVLCVTYTVAD